MTLLYGRDASGNQVPLLVDGSGIVQTSGGGGASWPGTSSQLTAGDGTAVNVGSGLSLVAGTLTTTQMPAVASTAVNRWTMSESSGTTFTDSIGAQVLTYSPLGSSVLTYGANRVMAISPSVDFAPTASDTSSTLSCSSASFPTITGAGQARMMEAYLRFNNTANPAGTLFLLMCMILNVNNRIVVYANSGTIYVYCERNSVIVSNNFTGPSLANTAIPYGGNRTMHVLVAEDPNTVNLYINGQVYSGAQPSNKLYAAGTYTFGFLNAPFMTSSVAPSSTPTSAEIAEITLHNGLTPTGYASTQAYATARAMLLDKRW